MTAKLQIANHDLQATVDCTADSEPQHIAALLPLVLARYGIVLPRQSSAITSARLRRRMGVPVKNSAPKMPAQRQSMSTVRSANSGSHADNLLAGVRRAGGRRSKQPVQLSLFSAVG